MRIIREFFLEGFEEERVRGAKRRIPRQEFDFTGCWSSAGRSPAHRDPVPMRTVRPMTLHCSTGKCNHVAHGEGRHPRASTIREPVHRRGDRRRGSGRSQRVVARQPAAVSSFGSIHFRVAPGAARGTALGALLRLLRSRPRCSSTRVGSHPRRCAAWTPSSWRARSCFATSWMPSSPATIACWRRHPPLACPRCRRATAGPAQAKSGSGAEL